MYGAMRASSFRAPAVVFKQPVAHFANRAAAPGVARDAVRGAQHGRMGVADSEREADGRDQGQVTRVVDNAANLGMSYAELLGNTRNGAHFVVAGLDHMPNAKLPATFGNGRRFPSGDYGNAHARPLDELDAKTITHVKCFQRLACRTKVQASVREDSVHVEHQQADRRAPRCLASARARH